MLVNVHESRDCRTSKRTAVVWRSMHAGGGAAASPGTHCTSCLRRTDLTLVGVGILHEGCISWLMIVFVSHVRRHDFDTVRLMVFPSEPLNSIPDAPDGK